MAKIPLKEALRVRPKHTSSPGLNKDGKNIYHFLMFR